MEQSVFSLVGLCLLAAMLVLVLRRRNPEQAFALTVAASCVAGIYLFGQLAPLLERVQALGALAGSAGFECVLKSIGICLLTQTACDTCADFGQTAMAGKIELAGKLAILTVSLPLVEAMLSVVESLLG